MTQVQINDQTLRRQCDAEVERLGVRHGWRLLEPAEFARRAADRMALGASTDAHRAATFVYSEALYAACSGVLGDARREQGYRELHCWLYDVAGHRYADVAEDAAQQALFATFQSFGRCRRPGTFLMFALFHLRDAARAARREAAGDASLDNSAALLDDAPSPETLAERGELRAQLEQCRGAFLARHPRAAAQFEAVWLKFVCGLDDHAISLRLNTPVAAVYVLRARGLRKLEADADWLGLALELGLRPGQ